MPIKKLSFTAIAVGVMALSGAALAQEKAALTADSDLGGDTANLFQSAARDAYARHRPGAMLVGASCTGELIQDDPGGLAEDRAAGMRPIAIVGNAGSAGTGTIDDLDALADTITGVAADDPNARLNIVAGNGSRLLATTWGDTLSVLRRDNGVVLASEPYDDDPGWQEIPDRHLVEVENSRVHLTPLRGS